MVRYLSIYRARASKYALAVQRVMGMEAEKAGMKHAAILRLMEQTNPTSRDGKPHSASSAEAVVEFDPTYRAWLGEYSNAVADKIKAEAAMESGRIMAEAAARTVQAE
jgi:hypothetical protein